MDVLTDRSWKFPVSQTKINGKGVETIQFIGNTMLLNMIIYPEGNIMINSGTFESREKIAGLLIDLHDVTEIHVYRYVKIRKRTISPLMNHPLDYCRSYIVLQYYSKDAQNSFEVIFNYQGRLEFSFRDLQNSAIIIYHKKTEDPTLLYKDGVVSPLNIKPLDYKSQTSYLASKRGRTYNEWKNDERGKSLNIKMTHITDINNFVIPETKGAVYRYDLIPNTIMFKLNAFDKKLTIQLKIGGGYCSDDNHELKWDTRNFDYLDIRGETRNFIPPIYNNVKNKSDKEFYNILIMIINAFTFFVKKENSLRNCQ
jgi:hypothetical protein